MPLLSCPRVPPGPWCSLPYCHPTAMPRSLGCLHGRICAAVLQGSSWAGQGLGLGKALGLLLARSLAAPQARLPTDMFTHPMGPLVYMFLSSLGKGTAAR